MTESANKRTGGESFLAKLSELMFIEVVRQHLETLPPEETGWLAGLRDPLIGKALSVMHGNLAQNWTIEQLTREVGLSRSVLAERFAAVIGIPPMQYLARWRMQIASGLLSGGRSNIATIATEIGYGSEAAFSRAFKKMVGMSPSAWRPGQHAPRPMAQTLVVTRREVRPFRLKAASHWPTYSEKPSPKSHRYLRCIIEHVAKWLADCCG